MERALNQGFKVGGDWRGLCRGLAERGAVETNNRKDGNAKFVNLGLFLQSRPSRVSW